MSSRNIMKRTDYLYCGNCEMFVDYWKYQNLEDTGHNSCSKIRNVTGEELSECVAGCHDEGCFDEEFLFGLTLENISQ
jgi:hypothetical protein